MIDRQYYILVKKLIKGILSFLIVFMFLEGGSRIGKTIYDDFTVSKNWLWYNYSSDLGWERKPNFNGNIDTVRRAFDSRGFFVSDTKQIADKKKAKIAFIGDSITFGYNVATHSTFVELLDNLLPHIDAVNLGVIGYSSYQGYKSLLKFGEIINPSIIVVSFNYNDRRFVLKDTDIDGETKFAKSNSFIPKILDKVYLYKSIKFIFQKAGIIKIRDTIRNVNLKNLHPRVSPENYRKNLIKIINFAEERNISLIFLMLKDNPIQTMALNTGIRLLKEKKYTEAIKMLKKAARSFSEASVLSRKYLSEAYKRIGDKDKAEETLILNESFLSFLGGYPIYIDSEYNEIMKSVAQKYNIRIVDAGNILDRYPATYHDFCHPNEYGHQKIAELLYKNIIEMLP